MEPVSFAFGAVSFLEVCIRLGKALYKRCQAYQHADRELQEANLCIQGHWIKIEHQLSALRDVWPALGNDLQVHQNLVLQVLQGRLQTAVSRLDSLIDPQRLSGFDRAIARVADPARLRYAARAKTALVAIIDDLERWQRAFDPSWFFLARISVPLIDEELTRERADQSDVVSTVVHLRQAHKTNRTDSEPPNSMFLSGNYAIDKQEFITSSVFMGYHADQKIIVDHVPLKEYMDVTQTTKDVRSLVRVLSTVGPDHFGLLSALGVIKTTEKETLTGFNIIFAVPPHLSQSQPRSLRSVLTAGNEYNLDERFKLAISLACSLVYLHSSSIIHKNISPENIILFPTPGRLGVPFLVGFERFRPSEGRTYMTGDAKWERNLYRHPRRQGLHPEEEYSMQHDIYSLGVCLLEVGLWTSFVQYTGSRPLLGSGLPIGEFLCVQDGRRSAVQIKQALLEMAESRLPVLMGKIDANVVVSCLTCLDWDGSFGNKAELEDEDGILVGVRYIEKILYEIEKIVV
ncbi:hypothetical protein AFCA_008517 [Aspergillus flavus]|uniref:Protein kinase domain-containing protein n=1 Tax=Aspergillus flavus TaxID=5059 RepID=A0AB74CQ45_ASPFL|nr:hypothetical protein CA14_009466 [Aspergillus flavus]UDD61135.1 hypothetical protein AFCA_008517 [Aspergillus flavus]